MFILGQASKYSSSDGDIPVRASPNRPYQPVDYASLLKRLIRGRFADKARDSGDDGVIRRRIRDTGLVEKGRRQVA